MNLPFYDMIGRYKIITLAGGHSFMCGPQVDCRVFADWVWENFSRYPTIISVYEIPTDMYEEWTDRFRAKGLLCEGEEGGGL